MLPQFSMDVNPNMQSNLHLVLKNHVEAKYRAMQEAELAAAEAERAAELDRLNAQAWAAVVLQDAHGINSLDVIAESNGKDRSGQYYFFSIHLSNGSLRTSTSWRTVDIETYLPTARWDACYNTGNGEVWKQFSDFLDAALFAMYGTVSLRDLRLDDLLSVQ